MSFLLQRWQIGEIASKIGQLYYHYYLRTSDTNYLSEAFSFYAAIRARGYYSKMVNISGLSYVLLLHSRLSIRLLSNYLIYMNRKCDCIS